MLNHITLRVADLEASKKFFLATLTPLGYALFVEKEKSAGFGQVDIKGNRDFWIKSGDISDTKSFSCLAFTFHLWEQSPRLQAVPLGGRVAE